MKRFDSTDGNVWKYVFDFDGAIAEAVLYRYGSFMERTVLCVSVQSGCPVGCTFCGTGNRFIRNLTADEIVGQVADILDDQNLTHDAMNDECQRFQVMFMSMGEPFLNYENVRTAIFSLHSVFRKADLLVSTIAPHAQEHLENFIAVSRHIPTIGLQFSIHESIDQARNGIIPYKNKLNLLEIRNYGIEWWHRTGRKPYLNYCITDRFDGHDSQRLMAMFPQNVFCFTFSVLCSSDESMKDAGYRDLDQIRQVEELFAHHGYDTRIFDPAGQDDIGGGCGQLWYVQKHMKTSRKAD